MARVEKLLSGQLSVITLSTGNIHHRGHCLVLKVWQITLKSFSQEQSKSPSYQFYDESLELGASVPLILTFCFLGRGGRHAGELDQPEAGVPGDDAGPRR